MNKSRLGMMIGVLVLGLVGTGCPSPQEAAVAKSKALFESSLQGDSQVASYTLDLAASSKSPFVRETMVRMLESDDYATARAAMSALLDNPPPEARDALQSVFDTKTGLLTLNAAIALARLGDDSALAHVREEVLAEGGSLTLHAAMMLVDRGETEGLQPILAARITSEEPTVRDEAYVLLGEIKQPWSTALLVEGLGKEHGERRQQAIMSLGQSGDPAVADEISPFVNTKGLVFSSLEALGALRNEETTPTLEAMVQHENPLVQLYAAVALWRVGGDETAIAHLEPIVTDLDPTLRVNLAEQLGRVDSPKAVEMLAALTADEDHEVRLAAFQSLASKDAATQVDLFVEAAGGKDYTVASVALDALARIGGEAQVEAIAARLEDPNKYVAVSAANAILSITGA